MQERNRATITLARPERGNALGAEMVAAIVSALDAALADGARFVLFRGAGGNFCTGLDLSDLAEMSEGDLALRILRIEMLPQRIHALPVMTAAVAGGRVFGAGADLFAVCDHRIALEGASFAVPGPAFGLVLGPGRLSALHGRTRRADDAGDVAALARSVARPGLKARITTDSAARRPPA